MKNLKRLRERRSKVLVAIMMSMIITQGLYSSDSIIANAQEQTSNHSKSTVNHNQKRNVMYYGEWSIWGGQENFYPKDIPADKLTHLNFAFLDFDSNGNLKFTDRDAAVGAPVGQDGVQWGAANAGVLSAFQELKVKNPNLKIGVSLGGWSKSGDFSEVASNPDKRAKLVKNVLKFIEYTNMDFVDIDWEYPCDVRQPDLVDNKNDEGTPNATKADKENYIKLLQEFRTELDKQGNELNKGYELSVAIPAPKSKVDLGIDIKNLFNIVDFTNIMTYDMRGAWDEYSGHQTSLYPNENDPIKGNNLSIDETVDYLVDKGAEKDKIVIGAAYYTRGWDKVEKGSNNSLPGIFNKASITTKDADQTPSRGAVNEAPLASGDGGRMSGVWSYRSLDKLKSRYPGLKEYWDDTAKAPYLYDESTGKLFTYDNVKSITEKTKYVNENDLGGMIGWMAAQDAKTDSSKRDELTKASKEGLFGNEKLPENELTFSELDVKTSINPYQEQWGVDKNGYEITIKNNEVLEESQDVLSSVEKGAETIKAPKLYIKSDKALNAGDHMAGNVKYENGFTIVDLQSVWEGKNIEPGKTYTFKLKGDANISGIDLVQRMSENGVDMYRQSIFGDSGEVPQGNQAPVLHGVDNKTINIGDSFDKLAGVTATDNEDGNITNKIKVDGSVDTSKAGNYKLVYSVEDSKGLKTEKDRVITVKGEEPPQGNQAPVLHGVDNKTINIGDSFNKLAGVTATDNEDGDITNKIKVDGSVDTSKAGNYKLVYSVEDSKGLKTEKDRVITVKKGEEPSEDTYDPNKIYLEGDSVIFKGEKYVAKWWVRGEDPDESYSWKKIIIPNEDGSIDYYKGLVCQGGELVRYEGHTYKAKHWTNTIPGSDNTWEFIK